MAAVAEDLAPLSSAVEPGVIRTGSRLLRPIEAISAVLLSFIIILLLMGVTSRYVFSIPVVWIDEAASICFLWLAMLGSAIALDRNEHLRLTIFLGMFPEPMQGFVQTLALASDRHVPARLMEPSASIT